MNVQCLLRPAPYHPRVPVGDKAVGAHHLEFLQDRRPLRRRFRIALDFGILDFPLDANFHLVGEPFKSSASFFPLRPDALNKFLGVRRGVF